MRLDVLDRLMLLDVLPPTGNVLTLKIVRTLRESLSFNEDELAALNMQQQGEQVIWDRTKEDPKGKEIVIGERATDLIITRLKELNEKEKLTPQHLSICEKFGLVA